MAAKKDTSNAGIYDKLESLRLEVKQDITVAVNTVSVSQGRLEKKFDDLEAGRLTRNEGAVQDLRIKMIEFEGRIGESQATLSTKFLIIWSMAGAIFVAIMTALAYRLIVAKK